MKFCFQNLPKELIPAVADVLPLLSLEEASDGIAVAVKDCETGFSVEKSSDGLIVSYARKADLFRALTFLWLAPTQVKLLAVADRHLDYVYEIKKQLDAAGLRTEVDDRSEKIGYKIRQAQLEKVPYMIIVGDKDIEAGVVSVRHRKDGDLGAMQLDAFLALAKEEIDAKTIK